MQKKVVLMILDGWGIATNPDVSAIDKANTPFIDSLYSKYPNSKLEASGLAVGLPQGQMGNSEVGHMNIGAGRVVYQDLVRINKAVEEKTLGNEKVLTDAFAYAKKEGKNVHFLGLVSDGGVHSHINHLKGLCALANDEGVQNVFIHAFSDGRDTDPKGCLNYMKDLESCLSKTNAKVASIIGRYYAMDRDQRWERVKLAYDLIVNEKGSHFNSAIEAIQASYDEGITDEFIKPAFINGGETIKDGDVVMCFNFRTDRGREITQALTQRAFPEKAMQPVQLNYLTMPN